MLIIGDSVNGSFSYNLSNFDSGYEQIWEIFHIAISTLYFTTIFTIVLYISLILFKSKKLPIIDKIGVYSFALYLVHPMILEVIVSELSKIGFDWNNLLFYPSVFILTLILSMFSVKIINQIPYVNTLLAGVVPAKLPVLLQKIIIWTGVSTFLHQTCTGAPRSKLAGYVAPALKIP